MSRTRTDSVSFFLITHFAGAKFVGLQDFEVPSANADCHNTNTQTGNCIASWNVTVLDSFLTCTASPAFAPSLSLHEHPPYSPPEYGFLSLVIASGATGIHDM
ncbi:hypothetical protein C8R47DRAFT_441359 [Mycena vitilis]|nr:hypothetical protein C8R47DRAFT_441359 [Mycena vitilis]